MKKLLFIAVVVVGVSALVLAGKPGGFGRRGYANRPGWMHPESGGRGQYGPLCNWQGDITPPLMLGMLDLTDEQKETITALVEESRAKLKADIEAVLTDEQIEKLEQLRENPLAGPGRPGRGFPGVGPRGSFGGPDDLPPVLEVLDLTEEQQAAITEIHEKARVDAEAAETRQARREIMQAAHEEVLSILTEEQIEKLEELREKRPRGRGRPSRGRW